MERWTDQLESTIGATMRILVTGSSGHLGEGLVRTLRGAHQVIGIDILPSPYTTHVGSIANRAFVRKCMDGVDVILHTATLHKPHAVTHTKQQFVETNISGTLNLLEEAVAVKATAFIFTSTTSAFGHALSPASGEPAVWITEDVADIPKNIYGVTKTSAEDLCELCHREHRLPCLILRTSRFFPEEDDNRAIRDAYDDTNTKVNELLNRRADLEDIVSAHVLAMDRAPSLGFGKYIISATTPFLPKHLPELRTDAPTAVARLFPAYVNEYKRRGWRMFPTLDRVYDNTNARRDLGWNPRHSFSSALDSLQKDQEPSSVLARTIGSKRHHEDQFMDEPYPVAC